MNGEERARLAKETIGRVVKYWRDTPNAYMLPQDDGTFLFTFIVENESGHASITYNPQKAVEQIILKLEEQHPEIVAQDDIMGVAILKSNVFNRTCSLLNTAPVNFSDALWQLPTLADVVDAVEMKNLFAGQGKGQKELIEKMLLDFNTRTRKHFRLTKQRAIVPFRVLTQIRKHFYDTGKYPSQHALARALAGSNDYDEIKKAETNLANWRKSLGYKDHDSLIKAIREGEERRNK